MSDLSNNVNERLNGSTEHVSQLKTPSAHNQIRYVQFRTSTFTSPRSFIIEQGVQRLIIFYYSTTLIIHRALKKSLIKKYIRTIYFFTYFTSAQLARKIRLRVQLIQVQVSTIEKNDNVAACRQNLRASWQDEGLSRVSSY